MNFGGQEMIVILVIVLVLFGGKKIPELMRGIGKGVGELQKGLEESKRTLNESLRESESDSKIHEIHPQPAEHSISRDSIDEAS